MGAHPWAELMVVSAGARSHPQPALSPALVEGFGPKIFIPWEPIVWRVGGHEALLSIGNGSHELTRWPLRESTSHEAQMDSRATQLWPVLHLVCSQPGPGAAASPGDAQRCWWHQELLFSFASSRYNKASGQAPLAAGDTSASSHHSC